MDRKLSSIPSKILGGTKDEPDMSDNFDESDIFDRTQPTSTPLRPSWQSYKTPHSLRSSRGHDSVNSGGTQDSSLDLEMERRRHSIDFSSLMDSMRSIIQEGVDPEKSNNKKCRTNSRSKNPQFSNVRAAGSGIGARMASTRSSSSMMTFESFPNMSTNVASITGMDVDISGNSDPRDISASITGTMTWQQPIASGGRSELLPPVWPSSSSVLASALARSPSHGPVSRTASVLTRRSPTSDSVSRLKDVEVGTFDGSKPWMISNSSIATFGDDYDSNTRPKQEQRSSTAAASFGKRVPSSSSSLPCRPTYASYHSSHLNNHGRGNRSPSGETNDDDGSVVTLQSVDTLLGLMQMSLDEDWWQNRTTEWEASRAKPVKPALQTKEDKEILKQIQKRRREKFYKTNKCFGRCRGIVCEKVGSISKKWMIFWIILFSLIVAATIVVLTTNFGADAMNSFAETIAGVVDTIRMKNAVQPWKKMVGDEGGRGSSAYEENDYSDNGSD